MNEKYTLLIVSLFLFLFSIQIVTQASDWEVTNYSIDKFDENLYPGRWRTVIGGLKLFVPDDFADSQSSVLAQVGYITEFVSDHYPEKLKEGPYDYSGSIEVVNLNTDVNSIEEMYKTSIEEMNSPEDYQEEGVKNVYYESVSYISCNGTKGLLCKGYTDNTLVSDITFVDYINDQTKYLNIEFEVDPSFCDFDYDAYLDNLLCSAQFYNDLNSDVISADVIVAQVDNAVFRLHDDYYSINTEMAEFGFSYSEDDAGDYIEGYTTFERSFYKDGVSCDLTFSNENADPVPIGETVLHEISLNINDDSETIVFITKGIPIGPNGVRFDSRERMLDLFVYSVNPEIQYLDNDCIGTFPTGLSDLRMHYQFDDVNGTYYVNSISW